MRAAAMAAVKGVIPDRVRTALRRMRSELPVRFRDMRADLREWAEISRELPLPPAWLRGRVGFTSSREEYLTIGGKAARDLLAVLEKVRPRAAKPERWLDFGCGCGRIARHLQADARVTTLYGVDVNAAHIRWLRRHLPGEWQQISAIPPTHYSAELFDVIVCVSVFTHLDEATQDAWLSELVRLLRPNGILLATTHGPALARACPGLTAQDFARLDRDGFLFRAGPGSFSDQAAFHSEPYLRGRWGQYLELGAFCPAGLVAYQDLAVWRKPLTVDRESALTRPPERP